MTNKFMKGIFYLGGLFIISLFIGLAAIVYFSMDLPKISTLADYRPALPSHILAKDGTVLAEIGPEKREIIQFDRIPKVIVNSFLAAEDDSFYHHKGVDYLGVLRALLVNIKAGRVVQGGSTITQQVAKSLLLTKERSISRKVKDFLLAQRIEKKFSKEEILFLYLNQVYLGGGYYGVKTAFEGYFAKQLSEVTIAEAAMVAGLLVAPGKYSPYANPEYAKKRQMYVLGRLFETGKINKEEYENAKQENIKFSYRRDYSFKSGYFTEWIRQKVTKKIPNEEFLTGGFKILTTLDWELQKSAEKQVLSGTKEIDKRQGYKGPLKSGLGEKEIEEFEKDFWIKHLEEKSKYFTISDKYQKINEFFFDENDYHDLKNNEKKISDQFANYPFIPGYINGNPLVSNLDENENYKAVVLKIVDSARLIFVSLGGVVGIIPYEGFRWAHNRVIKVDREYYPYVTKPSTILKEGDVILVELRRKIVHPWNYIDSSFKSFYDKKTSASNFLKMLKEQNYLLLNLDQNPEVQGALVSLSPKTGEIVSFVGGNNFSESQFNRVVQSKRQPGSSFKPILYACGLENGFNPASIIIDSPEALTGVDEGLNWKPRNYDGEFKGPITYRNALEQSRNIPTIKIAEKIGVKTILDFTQRIGFNANLDKDLSLALGSFGVSLINLVKTYGLFPNGGKIVRPKAITAVIDRDGRHHQIEEKDNDGELIEEEKVTNDIEKKSEEEIPQKKINPFHVALSGDQVYDPRLSYLMSNLLKGVILHGTGKGAKSVSSFIGGKTGTTNDYVDAWFIGFSSNLVTGVWTGFDENETLGFGETGARAALPIWIDFMKLGLKKYGEYDFVSPLGIINISIDKETGRPAKGDKRASFVESFAEGTEPGSEQKTELNSQGEPESTDLFEDDEYYNRQ